MREWKKREGSEGDACNRLGKVKGKGIGRNGGEEKEVDGREKREAKEKESRKGMERERKREGKEERRKASKDGICVERLGTGKRDARKWIRIEGSGWDR